jgi:hypothetical protein
MMTRRTRTTSADTVDRIEATAQAAAQAIRADATANPAGSSQRDLLERTRAIQDPLVRHRTAELLIGDENPGEDWPPSPCTRSSSESQSS